MYPNLYTVLVGRPATGKGAAIDPALEILKEAGTANVLSDRLTIEYVLEKLSKGFPSTTLNAGTLTVGVDSSAIVFAPELSVFIRDSSDSLSDLTQLWDNRDSFDYGTRHKGLYTVNKPCLSMLGGSPPAWLAKSIPNDAVGGGFTRRVNFVYTKNDPHLPTWSFASNGTRPITKDDLVEDLRYISSNIRGEFRADKKFERAFDAYTAGIKFEDFDDEATTGFKASKWVNAVKLAMVLSVSRGDDRILIEDDWATATMRVEQVEQDLGLVFRAVGESDDTAAAAKILDFIEKRGVTSLSDIMRSLWRHVSKPDAERIMSTFVSAQVVSESTSGHTVLYTCMLKRTGGP